MQVNSYDDMILPWELNISVCEYYKTQNNRKENMLPEILMMNPLN